MKIDHHRVARLRREGKTFPRIAEMIGHKRPDTLRSAHGQWCNRQPPPGAEPLDAIPPEDRVQVGGTEEEWLAEHNLDPERWEVRRAWSGTKGISVQFELRPQAEADDLEAIHAAFLEDAKAHAPAYEPVERVKNLGGDSGEGILFELAMHDPHFGMLAWRHETLNDYDLNIAIEDYQKAVEGLLAYAHLYNTERILFVVGHDTMHVNQYEAGGKGATTRAGTSQDVDGRMSKITTAIRRAMVRGIDAARLIAPVDVVIVPGNHDPDRMYDLGESLFCWYHREGSDVDIQYGPNKRKWYDFGRNAFMLTHGEEYARQRDSLPLIMATEMPHDMRLRLGPDPFLEVHTGHNHIRKQGRYTPTSEVSETRAIVTRSLPGITATDTWHFEQGYRHRRAATALTYGKTEGFKGLHEFQL